MLVVTGRGVVGCGARYGCLGMGAVAALTGVVVIGAVAVGTVTAGVVVDG